jgi:hypothetical protein
LKKEKIGWGPFGSRTRAPRSLSLRQLDLPVSRPDGHLRSPHQLALRPPLGHLATGGNAAPQRSASTALDHPLSVLSGYKRSTSLTASFFPISRSVLHPKQSIANVTGESSPFRLFSFNRCTGCTLTLPLSLCHRRRSTGVVIVLEFGAARLTAKPLPASSPSRFPPHQ